MTIATAIRLGAFTMSIILSGCASQSCNPNQLALTRDDEIVVSNGANLFLFGRDLKPQNTIPSQWTDAYDNELLKYPNVTIDRRSGALYVAQHFRSDTSQSNVTIELPERRFPQSVDNIAPGRDSELFITIGSTPTVLVGTLDRKGYFRSRSSVPMSAPGDDSIEALASDSHGGFCAAYSVMMAPKNEQHVDCFRRVGDGYVEYATLSPATFGQRSITGLAIAPDDALFVSALEDTIYAVRDYAHGRPTVRRFDLPGSQQQRMNRSVVLDDSTVIVSTYETHSIVGYDALHLDRVRWSMRVGAPGSGPWTMAVADGMLYVGELPNGNPREIIPGAPHDVLRFTLRGTRRPVPAGSISGETLDFDAQDIAVSGNGTLLAKDPNRSDITVITSAAHHPHVLDFIPATTLFDEELIAVASDGSLYGSDSDGSLREYPPNASMQSAPLRTIDANHREDSSFAGMAADDFGNVFRSDPQDASINVTRMGASVVRPHVGSIRGARTLLSEPQGLALDERGNLYVANRGGDDVLMFAAGSRGDVAPSRIIGSRASGMSQPTSVGVASDGSVLVVDSPSIGSFFPKADPSAELLRFSSDGARANATSFRRACQKHGL